MYIVTAVSTRKPSTSATGAPTPPALRLDRQLCFALYSASLAMTKAYQPLLIELGLTYPQYLVLLVLWERDALSVGELGEKLSLDSGTLTPLLKRMQAAGLLQRQRSAADERRVCITLTDAGRRLRERAASLPQRAAAATGCSRAQLDTLRQALGELRRNLTQAADA